MTDGTTKDSESYLPDISSRKWSDSECRCFIVRITSIAYLVNLILSWRAYIHDLRIFSLAPVLPILAHTSAATEWVIFIAQIGFLIRLLRNPLSRAAAAGALGCTLFWILQDLFRFQPYIFMYSFTILFAVFFSIGGINALKIMIGSVYFWAGFHKLNMTFFSTIFPWFVEPLYKISYDSGPIGSFITLIVFSVPIFEASIGILLLFYPEKWKFASIMAFIMLATVMICLGPLGHNWNQSVWPWNIYLFLVEYSLFYKLKGDGQRVLLERNLATILSITLFSFAPALPLVGLGHSYPAFKLYSGNTKYAEVVFSNSETLAALPEGIKKLVMNNHGTLPLVEWTVYESNVATYPESYVYKKGAKGLCPYLTDKDGAILRIYSPPHFYSLSPTHEDFPLCQDVSIEQTGNNSNALKP